MSVLTQSQRHSGFATQSAVKPCRLRLPYNALFLPEYISTVMLSLLISWFFVANVNVVVRSWHIGIAGICYTALACGLLWMTWRHRVVYSDVIIRRDSDGRLRMRVAREWIDVEHLDSLEESAGTFFGRATRVLVGRSNYNGTFEVNQCLSGYDQLKEILKELRGIDVSLTERHTEDEISTLSVRWTKRHRVFPPAFTTVDAAGRLGFRFFCLLPVAVIDVAINAILNTLLQNAGHGVLAVYVAPLSLLVSAFIARYVYYYMFTSTRLNQRIG